MRKIKALDTKKLDRLYEGILKLEKTKECKAFFRDLCTMGELQEFSERFEVAELVDQGVPYREIAKRTGVSTATITRVAQWLHHGEEGYKTVIERLKKMN
jgi:TrpR-related protein YerC/YecD